MTLIYDLDLYLLRHDAYLSRPANGIATISAPGWASRLLASGMCMAE